MQWIECNTVGYEPHREIKRFIWFPIQLPVRDSSGYEYRWGWQKIVQWERLHLHYTIAGIGGAHSKELTKKIWKDLSWA